MQEFRQAESGAVTVDWVVLTAGLVGLGLAVMAVVSTGVQDTSTDVQAQLTNNEIIKTSFVTVPSVLEVTVLSEAPNISCPHPTYGTVSGMSDPTQNVSDAGCSLNYIQNRWDYTLDDGTVVRMYAEDIYEDNEYSETEFSYYLKDGNVLTPYNSIYGIDGDRPETFDQIEADYVPFDALERFPGGLV